MYNTHLTVLPEYNLAAAVSSTGGGGGSEAMIVQEIILAVLEEEGLIPEGAVLTAPVHNMERALVPEGIKSNAGIYAAGSYGQYSVEFTEDSLILTPIGKRNERPMEFIYNTDGVFISADGDFIGITSLVSGAVGVTSLTFDGDYIVFQSYESIPGAGDTAEAMPFAERVKDNPVSDAALNAWTARNNKEYLLVSEKYTSGLYIKMSGVGSTIKTLTDERLHGYVLTGVYDEDGYSGGTIFPAARIVDEYTAVGFQSTPTMAGRDIVNLYAEMVNGVEYLYMNNFRYVESTAAISFSTLGETVFIGAEPVWVDIGSGSAGKIVNITTPENGSWFVYDSEMNCIATSLEKNFRSTIILPDNGRLVFAGETGAEFTVR